MKRIQELFHYLSLPVWRIPAAILLTVRIRHGLLVAGRNVFSNTLARF